MTKFIDSVKIAGTRIRDDGYLVADARVARSGIQLYAGWELGKPDKSVIRVYRPADEVFDKDAMGSFSHRPVTNDHPDEAVTADNWKDYAVGNTADEVARDGEMLRVPLMVADAAAIKDIQNGKRELSAGYSAELDWSDGVTSDGEQYDAIQRNIRANHIAIVDRARAGHKARIGDGWDDAAASITDAASLNRAGVTYANSLIDSGDVNTSSDWSFSASDGNALLGENGDDWENYGKHFLGVDDSADDETKAHWKYPFAKDGTIYRSALTAIRQRAGQQKDTAVFEAAGRLLNSIDNNEDSIPMIKVTVDGLTIETTEQGKQVIDKLTKQLSDANESLKAKDTELAKKDAAIDDLKAKQLDDAAIDARVTARADLLSTVAKIAPKVDTKGLSDADIRKAVVSDRFGHDVIKDKSDDYIAARFDILVEDAKGSETATAALGNIRLVASDDDGSKAEKEAHQRMLDRLNRSKKSA